jgi:hypothetical protein
MPQPAVPMPAPIMMGETPKPPPQAIRAEPPIGTPRNLLVAAGLAAAIALVGLGFVLMPDGGRTHVADRPHPTATAKPAHADLGSPTRGHFAVLKDAQIQARIEDAGYHVGRTVPTNDLIIWLLEPHVDTMQVHLHRGASAARADMVMRGDIGRPNKGSPFAPARDGNTALVVFMPQQAEANALRDHIVR